MKLGLILLCLCAATSAFAKPATLSLRIFADYESLDWQMQVPTPHRYLLANLMMGLFTINGNMELVAAQAKTVLLDADEVVYTIGLKPGLKWSDGVPVTAADYIRSWRRARAAAAKVGIAWVFTDIQDFNSIDSTTIRLRLKHRDPQFLYRLALPMMLPLRAEHLGGGLRKANFPVTGPYQLSGWDRGRGVFTLNKNPSYEVKNDGPETVLIKVLPASDDGRALFEKGQLDLVTGVDADALSRLSAGQAARYVPFDFLYLDYLFFNLHSVATRSPDLRAAISLALDSAELARGLNGGQRPGKSFILKKMFGYSGPKAVVDLVRAKDRLAAWRSASPANAARSVRFFYYDTKTSHKMAELIAKMLLTKIGLRVESRFFPLTLYPQALATEEFDAALYYISPDGPIPDSYLSRFAGANQRNQGRYESGTYLAAFASLGRTPLSRRAPVYEALESLLIEKDFVVVPLTEGVLPTLISERVLALAISPLNLLWLPDVRMK